MAQELNKLTARTITGITEPGLHGDGGGLFLQVSKTGAKSWIFRYKRRGTNKKGKIGLHPREMGLGSLNAVTLKVAREKAEDARKLLAAGKDPLDARRAAAAAEAAEAAKAVTFKETAEAYIASHEASWRNAKHRQQWRNTLESYAFPLFGAVSVSAIDTGLVMQVVEPLWANKTETASRLRGRIEAILDYAKARGQRDGENPARWRGHLDQMLPKRAKVQRVEHHAALPYVEIGAFVARLRTLPGLSARAMEFVILTGARTGEALGARWSEINLAEKVWIVPAARIKAGREHRIPLSARVMELLAEIAPLRVKPNEDGYLFPGEKPDKPLSSMALLMLLRRMKRDDITAHGFRSTFRDWASESTSFSREVAEMSLAHAIGDKVEAAYRRGDLFEKRRKLMEAWAGFCAAPAAHGKVVPIKSNG